MTKKLTRHGNSMALIIDKPLMQLLNINDKTELDISIQNNTLIIRPVIKKKSRSAKKDINTRDIDEIADKIMDKYADAFKKMAQ